MALNIEGATLGYDANNVQAAFNSLNENVIAETITQMTSSMSTLREAVDAVWVGQSAEKFKENMEYDKNYIIDCLNQTKEVLHTELNEIVNKMDEVDQNLVQGRE